MHLPKLRAMSLEPYPGIRCQAAEAFVVIGRGPRNRSRNITTHNDGPGGQATEHGDMVG